jgi:hypothetical protein
MTDTKVSVDYTYFGTNQGELRFGDVTIDGTKLAALIRNTNPSKSSDHFMAFGASGKFNGSTWNVCPGAHQIICGKTPVDGVSFLTYAENGDIVIGAPNGKIRIFAKDIELISTGTSNRTGFIQMKANGGIEIDSRANINIQTPTNINIAAEKQVQIVSPGEVKLIGPGDWLEDVDFCFGPINGAIPPLKFLEGVKKLIGSLPGG